MLKKLASGVTHMHSGSNQNVKCKGEIYHIQTEDGGKKNPVITTHLFKGGTILTSRRAAYSDILKSDRPDTAVREMMRAQHVRVLKDLKEGCFDERIEKHSHHRGAKPGG